MTLALSLPLAFGAGYALARDGFPRPKALAGIAVAGLLAWAGSWVLS